MSSINIITLLHFGQVESQKLPN